MNEVNKVETKLISELHVIPALTIASDSILFDYFSLSSIFSFLKYRLSDVNVDLHIIPTPYVSFVHRRIPERSNETQPCGKYVDKLRPRTL